jgi:hypothetical protein
MMFGRPEMPLRFALHTCDDAHYMELSLAVMRDLPDELACAVGLIIEDALREAERRVSRVLIEAADAERRREAR